MLLKAALNGRRRPSEHPAVPVTPAQLAHESASAVRTGAGAIHVHPRDADGQESLAPGDVAAALEAIRTACPSTPIGVSTGAWITPELDQRFALIGAWKVLPDFVSVNFHEPGALRVARLLLSKGVAVEAGIWNPSAAEFLKQSGWPGRCLRVLIEPAEQPGDPKPRFEAIEAALSGVDAPRLLHGFGTAAWEFVELAAERGYDTRIGFEDTLVLPDGTGARDNAELVVVARRLIGQRHA